MTYKQLHDEWRIKALARLDLLNDFPGLAVSTTKQDPAYVFAGGRVSVLWHGDECNAEQVDAAYVGKLDLIDLRDLVVRLDELIEKVKGEADEQVAELTGGVSRDG